MKDHPSMLSLILAWRPLIYRVTVAAIIVSVVLSLLMPNWYGATATCLPPTETESRGGILSMFTQLGMDFGSSGLLSTSPMADLMLGVLKSRRLRGDVVDAFDLVEVYNAKSRAHAIEELGDRIRVGTTSDGLIEVWVEDRDRQRAAGMANLLVELLDRFNRETSVEQARRTREFIETALRGNRTRLDEAAAELREYQSKHGAIQISEQTRVTLEAVAELELERTKLDMRRGVLKGFSTPDATQMREIEAEISELDRTVAMLKDGAGDSLSGAGVFLPVDDIPAMGLRLADLTREVMVQEKVYEYLRSQLAEARIRESRDLRSIQVLDTAVPPVRKSRPRRSLIVVLTTILALAGSTAAAFATEGALEYLEHREDACVSRSRELRLLLLLASRLRDWGTAGGRPTAAAE